MNRSLIIFPLLIIENLLNILWQQKWYQILFFIQLYLQINNNLRQKLFNKFNSRTCLWIKMMLNSNITQFELNRNSIKQKQKNSLFH
jgi:hypothetical protein